MYTIEFGSSFRILFCTRFFENLTGIEKYFYRFCEFVGLIKNSVFDCKNKCLSNILFISVNEQLDRGSGLFNSIEFIPKIHYKYSAKIKPFFV